MFNLQTFSYILTVTSPPILMLVYADRHISPLKEVRELAQRSMCIGGMFANNQ